jgi:SLOG-like protein
MRAIFLSASVPVVGRGNFYESADPFLIQTAVREFVSVALGRRLIVWGGHPAITPMVWAVCEDLGVSYASAVVLYQSKFFGDIFPEENKRFGNVVYVDAVEGSREQSLLRMRKDMLSRDDLEAAVFIGGMEGVLEEHALFQEFHPEANVLTVPSAGGAARQLAAHLGVGGQNLQELDFTKLFHLGLNVAPNEKRQTPL